MFKNLLLSLAAVSLVSAPAAAQPAPRDASPLTGEDRLGGQGSIGPLIISLALFAGLFAWVVVEMNEDDEEPVSP